MSVRELPVSQDKRTSCNVLQADVEHGIVQGPAHEKFQRKVYTLVSHYGWGLKATTHNKYAFDSQKSVSVVSYSIRSQAYPGMRVTLRNRRL